MPENINVRRAVASDIDAIVKFVDRWLASDFFVPRARQIDYLERNHVYLAMEGDAIVGWAVKERTNVLIHLLVAGDHRGQGVGRKLMEIMKPDIVRSKSDQSTGDPKEFYIKMGYSVFSDTMVGKNKNIQLMSK